MEKRKTSKATKGKKGSKSISDEQAGDEEESGSVKGKGFLGALKSLTGKRRAEDLSPEASPVKKKPSIRNLPVSCSPLFLFYFS